MSYSKARGFDSPSITVRDGVIHSVSPTTPGDALREWQARENAKITAGLDEAAARLLGKPLP